MRKNLTPSNLFFGWKNNNFRSWVVPCVRFKNLTSRTWGINSISCHGRLPPLIPAAKITSSHADSVHFLLFGKSVSNGNMTNNELHEVGQKGPTSRNSTGEVQTSALHAVIFSNPNGALCSMHLFRRYEKNNFFATSNQVLIAAKQLPESRNSSMFHLHSPPLYYQLLQWWCPHWQRHPWIVCACVPPETLTCKNVTCAEEHPPWASEPIVSNVLVSRGLEPRHFAGSPSSFHIAPGCGISRKFLSGK